MPMIGELFPTHLRATATGVSGSLAVTTAWLLAPLLISWGSEFYWVATYINIFWYNPTFCEFSCISVFTKQAFKYTNLLANFTYINPASIFFIGIDKGVNFFCIFKRSINLIQAFEQ